jgi:hypothetical protein
MPPKKTAGGGLGRALVKQANKSKREGRLMSAGCVAMALRAVWQPRLAVSLTARLVLAALALRRRTCTPLAMRCSP